MYFYRKLINFLKVFKIFAGGALQRRIQGRGPGEPGYTTLDKTTKQRTNQSVSNTLYRELSLLQEQFSIWRLSPKRFPVLYEKTSIDCSQSLIFSWDHLDISLLTVTAILIFKCPEGAGVGEFWHSCKMAPCNAKCLISMILRKNRGLWTVYKISNIRIFIILCRLGEGLTSSNKDLQVFWWKKKRTMKHSGVSIFWQYAKIFYSFSSWNQKGSIMWDKKNPWPPFQ